MNYSEVSDLEINKLVAEALGLNVADEQYLHYGDRDERVVLISATSAHDAAVDYCNNPSDAWPIMDTNNISIIKIPIIGTNLYRSIAAYGVEFSGFFRDHGLIYTAKIEHIDDTNPLRAAMIVFLKLKAQGGEG